MRSCLAFVSVVSTALIFPTLPASAKPSDSHNNLRAGLERFAATLKAKSADALNATSGVTARVFQDGKGASSAAEADLTQRLQEFRETLNERKATLGMIGEDAAARLKTWKHRTQAAWSDLWPKTWSELWTETMSAVHRSATAALDRLRDWIGRPSAPGQETDIPIEL